MNKYCCKLGVNNQSYRSITGITNMLPSGSARCLGDFYTGAYWGDIVANECIEEADLDQFNNEIWGASPYTDKLTEMSKVSGRFKQIFI